MAKTGPELSEDVHRICDVFREARQVFVVLPDLGLKTKQQWGSRVWTLTEALLSGSSTITLTSVVYQGPSKR